MNDLPSAEGCVINPREKGLQVGTKRRKMLTRPRVPMLVPAREQEEYDRRVTVETMTFPVLVDL